MCAVILEEDQFAQQEFKLVMEYQDYKLFLIVQNQIEMQKLLLMAAFVALMGKDVLMQFVAGLSVYWGSAFKNDEILYISGRRARVIRMGFTTTTFQMADRQSSMIVPNCQLKSLTIERISLAAKSRTALKLMRQSRDTCEDAENDSSSRPVNSLSAGSSKKI